MNAVFSLYKNYIDLIFSGVKDIEFRNKKIKVNNGDKIYMYETKKDNGRGKIVGYFVVGDIVEIPKTKIGCYNFLLHYALKNNYDEDIIKQIEKAMSVDLTNYDNSLVLDYIFDDIMLDYMIKYKKPMDFDEKLRRDDVRYQIEAQRKSNEYCKKVDNWLRKIGFYNEYDESYWKFYIKIIDYKAFEKPIDISEFQLLNGNYLKAAPQSFCYTKTDIN